MSGLRGRLGRLEGRAEQAAFGPNVLVVYPDDWPDADRDAWDAAWAAEDKAARVVLVTEHAGRAPGPGPRTTVLELRERADGPA
ncbi:MAG: hypothetical protein M3Q10_04255 [Chloroflexota bacterium]|nr:hypothetical protein [Chloroflexota bacterium]